MSYLINDLISCSIYLKKTRMFQETIFHHMIGIISIFSALYIGRAVGVFALCLMITELSTIFLNIRSIYKDLNLDEDEKYKKLFILNGYLLIFSFFFTRIIFLGIILIFYLIPVMYTYDY